MISYRFLDRNLIERWIDECSEDTKPELCWESVSLHRQSILLKIFATSLHYQEISAGCQDMARLSHSFYLSAQHALRSQGRRYCLETVQTHLVWIMYLMATGYFQRCWYVLGRTIQIMYALGMHRKRVTSSSTETHLERQCFWSAHVLDCTMSVILGRPRLINDSASDQCFPTFFDGYLDDTGSPHHKVDSGSSFLNLASVTCK